MTEPMKTETEETEESGPIAFDLGLHIHRLLMDEPFFAALSRRMDKKPSAAIPTAGVMVTEEGKLEMIYNPKFFAGLEDAAKKNELEEVSAKLVELRNVAERINFGHSINTSSKGVITQDSPQRGIS